MKKITALLLLAVLAVCALAGCGGDGSDTPKDFVAELKLDMESETLKVVDPEIKSFIDGDTTHFNVPTSVSETGVLKARYLAVNTPESTGKIEEWGKAASNFTKEKLKNAVSIVLESDDNKWNLDSTATRHLVWVWYKPAEDAEYRNLNLELLQNGLAIASNSANNRYGTQCMAAIAQASAQNLKIYSDDKDPDFYYGDVVALDLKELKYNIADYVGTKVSFECVVTKNDGQAIYVENYDAEDELVYGMYVYYGFGANGYLLDIISVGNRIKLVGSVQYYEAGDSYQISDLSYQAMRPDDPTNTIQLDEEKHEPKYVEYTVAGLLDAKHEVVFEDEKKTFDVAELALYSTVSMKGLRVTATYTTTNPASSDRGAISLTCVDENGDTITVRTAVLYNEDGTLVTEDYFTGKTIDVLGVVDYFNYEGDSDDPYQVKVFDLEDIVIK